MTCGCLPGSGQELPNAPFLLYTKVDDLYSLLQVSLAFSSVEWTGALWLDLLPGSSRPKAK